MRVRADIWVMAYLRRCQAQNAPAVVVQRGDEAAGAIFIRIDRLDGTVSLYGPAPAGLAGTETERRWVRCFADDPVPAADASDYLARQRNFDPDIWIVDVEDRAGRNFLDDEAARG